MRGTQEYAVASKVRAMYGKRLLTEDYIRMAGMRNVGELAGYLHGHRAYAEAIDSIQSGNIDRLKLEDAIQRNLLDEYFRILSFISHDDLVIMRFLVVTMELREIMRYMRLAGAGNAHEYKFDMPRFFERYSRIHYQRLSEAVTYSDLLEAVSDTPYHGELTRLELRESGWPDYTMVEMAVRRSYYRWVMSVIERNYTGARKAQLCDAVGFEVDMINIMAIIRIRRHFKKAVDNITSYLLPIAYKLKPEVIKRLLSAPDESAMLDVLRESGYKRIFSGQTYDEVDSYYYTGMIAFYRRQLRTGAPYVGTPMAYLFLKQLEIRNIFRLIECVQYGVVPEKAMTYLYLV